MKQSIGTMTMAASNDGKKYEPITEENIMEMAAKAAHTGIKNLLKRTGDKRTKRLLDELEHYKPITEWTTEKRTPRKTLPDKVEMQHNVKFSDYNGLVEDLIQVAALALYENMGNDDAFIIASNAVRNFQRKQGDRGRTTITIKDDNGNPKTVEVPRYKHAFIEDFEAGEIQDINDTISKIVDKVGYSQVIDNITAILSATQTKVLKYMAHDYSINIISQKVGISVTATKKHIHTIRQKARLLYPDGIQF